MAKKPRDHRQVMMLNASEVEAIDNWRFEHRIATRAGAMRRLIISAINRDEHEDIVEVLGACATILPRYAMAGKTVGEDEELRAVLERVHEAIAQVGAA